MDNNSFNFFTPTKLIFGSGSLKNLKQIAPLYGKKCLLVSRPKDGSLKGVSLNQTVSFAKSIPHSVIASGGVSSLNDISTLAKQFSNGVQGVIVGRALYDKKFSFSEALQRIKEAKI